MTRAPVEVLRSGDRVELLAVLTFGSGVDVRIRVRLQDRVDDAGEPVQLGPPHRLVNGGVKMYRRGGVKMYCGLGGSLSP